MWEGRKWCGVKRDCKGVGWNRSGLVGASRPKGSGMERGIVEMCNGIEADFVTCGRGGRSREVRLRGRELFWRGRNS